MQMPYIDLLTPISVGFGFGSEAEKLRLRQQEIQAQAQHYLQQIQEDKLRNEILNKQLELQKAAQEAKAAEVARHLEAEKRFRDLMEPYLMGPVVPEDIDMTRQVMSAGIRSGYLTPQQLVPLLTTSEQTGRSLTVQNAIRQRMLDVENLRQQNREKMNAEREEIAKKLIEFKKNMSQVRPDAWMSLWLRANSLANAMIELDPMALQEPDSDTGKRLKAVMEMMDEIKSHLPKTKQAASEEEPIQTPEPQASMITPQAAAPAPLLNATNLVEGLAAPAGISAGPSAGPSKVVDVKTKKGNQYRVMVIE